MLGSVQKKPLKIMASRLIHLLMLPTSKSLQLADLSKKVKEFSCSNQLGIAVSVKFYKD